MSKWAIALLKLGKFSQVVAVARQQLELIADASSPSDATVQDHFWCLYLLAYAQMQLPGARRVEIDGDLAEMRRLKTTLCGEIPSAFSCHYLMLSFQAMLFIQTGGSPKWNLRFWSSSEEAGKMVQIHIVLNRTWTDLSPRVRARHG